MSERFRISLSTRRFTIALTIVAAVLVVLHVVMWTTYFKTTWLDNEGEWISLLDLDTEPAFGTWFSTSMLLLAGILTLVQAYTGRGSKDRWNFWWKFLGIALIFCSLDEVAGLHESLNSDPRIMAWMGQWTIGGAVVSALLGIAFLPFLFRLPLRTRVLLIVSGIVYVGGAVGMEFATIPYEKANELNTLAYNLWNAVEEGLEMAGVIIYIYGLLDYMAGKGGEGVTTKVAVRRR